jgi:glycosyltransferase involved in cell wall biosynthesis
MVLSPLVSILIPSYNRADLISETFDSVMAQTYLNWECLVIDDGSTDQSVQIIEEYLQKDSRIKFFQRNLEPKGAPTCRNIGLNHAVGDFVIYLDSDDLLAPYCLSQRVILFQQYSDCDFIVFKSLLFDNQPEDAQFVWNIDTEEDDLLRFLRMDALWQTSGPIYKRDYLIQMKGFNEDLPFWQDFDLHLRCLMNNANYNKFFDLPADVYIRKGRNDTISRKISLFDNKDILLKRINFYRKLRSSFTKNQESENKQAIYTVDSMLYFFCAQFLIKHSNFRFFLKEWIKSLQITSLSLKTIFLSFIYVLMLKLSFRITMLKSLSKSFFINYKNQQLDYHLLDTNKVTIVKIESSSTNIFKRKNNHISHL